MLSTYHGRIPLTRLLLIHGADPNRLNDRGQSPLAGAVFKNEIEIVDILLEAGADVDAGRPSAAEAVELFKKGGVYGGKFEEARRRREGKEVGGVGGRRGRLTWRRGGEGRGGGFMSLRRILIEGWDFCIYLGRRHGFGYLWRWRILALDKGSIATRHFGFWENGVSTCRPQKKVPSFRVDSSASVVP